jgi:hypothetical protein
VATLAGSEFNDDARFGKIDAFGRFASEDARTGDEVAHANWVGEDALEE